MRKFELKLALLVFFLIVVFSLIPGSLWALTWRIESIDNGTNTVPEIDTPQYASIAVGSDDYPRIAYFNKFALLDEEGWHFEQIQKYVGFANCWGTSLQLDNEDRPHVFYLLEGLNDKLVYAYHDGTQWLVDQQDISSYYTSVFYSSMALDSSGLPHIVHPTTVYGLYYRHFDGTNWQTTSIPGGGYYPELKLDSQEKPHVATGSATSFSHSWYDGAQWQSLRANLGSTVEFTSLALDSSDQAFFLVSGAGLKLIKNLRQEGTSVLWTTETIEASGTFSQGRILIDSNGVFHIAYIKQSSNQLKYGYYDGAWHTEIVEQLSVIADNVSLAIDSKDRIHISYHDRRNNTVKYAHSVSSYYPESRFSVDVTGGSAPLSVQLSDQSSGQITSWYWEFGDGTTSTEQNPAHVYTQPGNFDISLTASGPGGSNTRIIRNCVWAYSLPTNQKYLAYIGKKNTIAPPIAPLAVIDCQSNSLILEVDVPEAPTSIAAARDGQDIYLAMNNAGGVFRWSILEPETGQYIPTQPGTIAVTISPDDRWVYGVTYSTSNYFFRMQRSDYSLSLFPLFNAQEDWEYGGASAIAVTPDGRSIFATTDYYSPPPSSNWSYYVAQLANPNSGNPSINPINVKFSVDWGVAVSPDNRKLYVSTARDVSNGSIVILPVDDLRKFRAAQKDFNSYVFYLAVSPDNKWLYSTLDSNSVSIIDTTTMAVVKTLSLTDDPREIAFTPDGKYAYVCSVGRVTVIDVATKTIFKRIDIGVPANSDWPVSIAIGPVPTVCGGDLDHDYDVDGEDLSKFAATPGDIGLAVLASGFGSTNCQWSLSQN